MGARLLSQCATAQSNRRQPADGEFNSATVERLALTKTTVGKWRTRFIERRIPGPYDDVRPGKPRTINDERVAHSIKTTGIEQDEALAAALLRHCDTVLAPRRDLLAAMLAELAAWCETEQARIEWVRPQAGALCCLRLRADRFDVAAVARIWDLLPAHQLQLARGTWFGESNRAFRLGFGYLPLGQLGPALAALTHADCGPFPRVVVRSREVQYRSQV